MFRSFPSSPALRLGLLDAFRTAGLAALLLLAPGSVLGFAVSIYVEQAFARVANLHVSGIPLASTERATPFRHSL